MNKVIYYIVVTAIGIAIGLTMSRVFFAPERVVETQRDTVFIKDTIEIEKPAEVKTEYVAERILVEVRDTLWLHDTLFVQLPMQKKFYKEDTYYAEVSGYNPNLDYLEIYQRTITVTKTETPKEKKNYIAVGVEAGWCNTASSIPIYLEYTRMLHKNVALRAGVFHDLAIQETGFRVGVNANVGW